MKKLLLLVVVAFFFMSSMAMAVDIEMEWDVSPGATGYKIYKSIDNGVTWDSGIDVGNIIEYTYLNVEETGLVIFRVSAYNDAGESVTYWAGAWYNHLWLPPAPTAALSIGQII